MSSNVIWRRERGARPRRAWGLHPVFAAAIVSLGGLGLASAQNPVDGVRSPPTKANPQETMKALEQARLLHERVLEADKKGGEPYADDLVRDILAFYHKGSVVEGEPGDPVVTRKFCREWVLGLFADLFQVGPCGRPDSAVDPSCPQNPLEEETAARFRKALTGFLATALDSLSEAQRERLYKLAGQVLRAEETVVSVLRTLALDSRVGAHEREIIEQTIEYIQMRANGDTPR